MGLKRRVWPPNSTGGESEENEPGLMSPLTSLEEPMKQPVSQPTAAMTRPIPYAPDTVMTSLLDQLVQAMTTRSEQSLVASLPKVMNEQWESQVRPLVQQELQAQLGSILSQGISRQSCDRLSWTPCPC